jgi:hypothetical protein
MYDPKAHPLVFKVECCSTRRMVGPRGLIFCRFCDAPGLPKGAVHEIPPEIKKWDVRM